MLGLKLIHVSKRGHNCLEFEYHGIGVAIVNKGHGAYICIYACMNWVIIGSGNGLSPPGCQTITWTNAIFFNWILRNKLQWNSNQENTFLTRNFIWKSECGPFLSSLSVLTNWWILSELMKRIPKPCPIFRRECNHICVCFYRWLDITVTDEMQDKVYFQSSYIFL